MTDSPAAHPLAIPSLARAIDFGHSRSFLHSGQAAGGALVWRSDQADRQVGGGSHWHASICRLVPDIL
eukprot:scaffold145681_cov40-Prasinocladus_malaysianus.AAC.1